MTLQQLSYVVKIADYNSMNKAAKALYQSQPSLSESIKDLEDEIGFSIFIRSNKGISLTPEGSEFLGYARQIIEQYSLVQEHFVLKKNLKKKFGVSMQHYTFAVQAFVEVAKKFGMDEYEFAVHETKTLEVLSDVKNYKSELGVLYINDFNREVLTKLIEEYGLEFKQLFKCKVYVYLWKGNPLAKKKIITMKDLENFPCLSFEQGDEASLFLAEEVLSTYNYKQRIKANDRATLLNLMKGINAYTLCSGIVCKDLNGSEYLAVPLDSKETMTIGYVIKKGISISKLGLMYIDELKKFKTQVMN